MTFDSACITSDAAGDAELLATPTLNQQLDELALACLANAGDIPAAVAMNVQRLRADPALLDAALPAMLADACRARMARLMSRTRRESFYNYEPTQRGERLHNSALLASRESVNASLMDFILPGGMALARAQREHLKEAAEFYGKVRADSTFKERWLNLIWKALPPGKTVGEALTPQELKDLRRKAQRNPS